jgi:hypothetical protein
MYAEDRTTIIDRREMLRVKLKSLAAEARIIRHEELRSKGTIRTELHRHRIDVVRTVARETHIAYGLIRGRTMNQMEPTRKSEPDWDAVAKMLKRYGPANWEPLLEAAKNAGQSVAVVIGLKPAFEGASDFGVVGVTA